MGNGALKLWVILSLCFCTAACQSESAKAKRDLNAELEKREAARKQSEELYRGGMTAYQASDLKEALHRLRRAVEVDDQNFAAWMALGVVEFKTDHYYEAAQAFDAAKRLQPSHYEPHFNLGTVFETVGRYTNAIDAYETALALAPDQVEVIENLARTYIKAGRNREKVRELLARALSGEYRPEWRYWLQTQEDRLANPTSHPTSQESQTVR